MVEGLNDMELREKVLALDDVIEQDLRPMAIRQAEALYDLSTLLRLALRWINAGRAIDAEAAIKSAYTVAQDKRGSH